MEKITIIYILGRAFTGSTILEMILGAHPEVASAGEIHYLERIKRNDRKIQCSCNSYVADCSVWSSVFEEYENKANAEGLTNIYQLTPPVSYSTLGYKHSKKLFSDEEIITYGRKNQLLFNAIKQHTGKNIIVDSSKHPQRLILLMQSGLFNIKPIYLYRDGRASVYSFKKRSSIHYNIFHRMYRIAAGEYILRKTLKQNFERNAFYGIRYENFTENFEKEIIPLLKFLELDSCKEIYTDKSQPDYFIHRINKGVNHIVGGNVYRLHKVDKIENRESWRGKLSKTEKFVFALAGGNFINRSTEKYLH